MSNKLIVVRDSGACELGVLKPYPIVQGSGENSVTSATNSAGATVYTVNSSPSVVNKIVNGNAIATHVSGSGVTTSIEETVTSLVQNGAGFTYTNEVGVATTISLCQLAHAMPDNGLIIGG